MNHALRLACVLSLTAFAGCGGGGGGGGGEKASKSAAPGAETPAPPAGGTTTGGTPGAAGGAHVTLTGKVNLAGTAPQATPIKMAADPVCVQKHANMPAVSQEIVADAAGMLQYVFVYVKSGLEGQTFETPTTAITLDQNGCMYSPHVFGVMVGQELKILNSDPTLHNIHALPKVEGNKEFNLGMPRQGMTFSKQFDKPEIMVHVKCDVHPWMSAYIGVLDHPYYAVTDANGSFSIPDLPPGTYTVEAWHEKFGAQTQSVTVGPAPTAEVNFTFQATGS
jgi:plastocyanin